MTSVDKFLKHLEQDGSVLYLTEILQNHSFQFKLKAQGTIVYNLVIRLGQVNKCFNLRIEMIFKGIDRVMNIIDATEISLDEYLEFSLCDNKDFKEYYDNLIKTYYK